MLSVGWECLQTARPLLHVPDWAGVTLLCLLKQLTKTTGQEGKGEGELIRGKAIKILEVHVQF